LNTDLRAKNKYFKLLLYGIIIVTNGTNIYMKQSNQNQLVCFKSSFLNKEYAVLFFQIYLNFTVSKIFNALTL